MQSVRAPDYVRNFLNARMSCPRTYRSRGRTKSRALSIAIKAKIVASSSGCGERHPALCPHPRGRRARRGLQRSCNRIDSRSPRQVTCMTVAAAMAIAEWRCAHGEQLRSATSWARSRTRRRLSNNCSDGGSRRLILPFLGRPFSSRWAARCSSARHSGSLKARGRFWRLSRRSLSFRRFSCSSIRATIATRRPGSLSSSRCTGSAGGQTAPCANEPPR